MEIVLKINNGKEIKLPIDEGSFNVDKPIIVDFKNRKGKRKIYSLRLTNKLGLVLN